MRRFTLALAAATVALGVTAASAADLGQRPVYKAQPAPVAIYNWSGFYIGGHAGYAWGREEITDNITGLVAATDPSGFLAGAQVGYNWQVGQWVFGIEGDWSWTNADGSAAIPGAIVTSEHNWYSTLTGRVGYAVDNTLWYVKGGAAWAETDFSIAGIGVSETRNGWTIGGGLEYGFTPNWSAKLEYNYLDFGKDSIAAPIGVQADTQVHLFKAGLNYRFDWGKAPVVARY
jgi:outer membrane immunogenic protein